MLKLENGHNQFSIPLLFIMHCVTEVSLLRKSGHRFSTEQPYNYIPLQHDLLDHKLGIQGAGFPQKHNFNGHTGVIGTLIGLIPKMILSTTYVLNICCCLRLKSNKFGNYLRNVVSTVTLIPNVIMSTSRGEYWLLKSPQISSIRVTFPLSRAEGPSADTKCPQQAQREQVKRTRCY